MIFEKHSELHGRHASLAPSQPYWLKYDDEELYQKYVSSYAQSMGTSLHELAELLIRKNLKLKKNDELVVLSHLLNDGIPRNAIDMDRLYENLRRYINDALYMVVVFRSLQTVISRQTRKYCVSQVRRRMRSMNTER